MAITSPALSAAQEMQRRLDNLRGLMVESSIDTALLTSYHNINYYGDFLYCSFGRSYGLIINEKSQTSISANIDGGQPARRTVGDNLVYTDWQQDNYYKAVASLIRGKQKVGIEFDQVSLQMLEKLKAALPGCEFVDIGVGAMKFTHDKVFRGDRAYPQDDKNC